MKKLLTVLFLLVLAGCSSNDVVDSLELNEAQEVTEVINMEGETEGFELIDDTVEIDNPEYETYKGMKRYEGEQNLSGKLNYPSAFDTPWYFVTSDFKSDGFDLSFLIDTTEELDAKLPESINPDCVYEFDAEVYVKDPIFNYTGNHLYANVDDYEILDISDDFVEVCN